MLLIALSRFFVIFAMVASGLAHAETTTSIFPAYFHGYTKDGDLATVQQVTELTEYSGNPDYARYETSITEFLAAHPEPVPLFVYDDQDVRSPAADKPGKFLRWVQGVPAVQARLKAGTVKIIQVVNQKKSSLGDQVENSRISKALQNSPLGKAIKNSRVPVTKTKIAQSMVAFTVSGLTTFTVMLMRYTDSELPFLNKVIAGLVDGYAQKTTTLKSDDIENLVQFGGKYDPKNPVKVHPLKENFWRFVITYVKTSIVLLPLEWVKDRASIFSPEGASWIGNYAIDYTIVSYFSGRTLRKVRDRYFETNGEALLQPYQESLLLLRKNPADFERTLLKLANTDIHLNPFEEMASELHAIQAEYGTAFARNERYKALLTKFEDQIIQQVTAKIKVAGGLTLYMIQSLLFAATSQVYYFNAMPWILWSPSFYFTITAGRALNWTVNMMFSLYYEKHPDTALRHIEKVEEFGVKLKPSIERVRSYLDWRKRRIRKPEEVRAQDCEEAIGSLTKLDAIYLQLVQAFSEQPLKSK